MSYRDKHRRHTNTSSDLGPYFGFASAELHFTDTRPRLTRRTIKITDRYSVEAIERKAGAEAVPFFGVPPKPAETSTKWSSEQTAEIEETYE